MMEIKDRLKFCIKHGQTADTMDKVNVYTEAMFTEDTFNKTFSPNFSETFF